MEKVNGFLENFFYGLPDLVAALLILFIGWMLARGIRSLLVKFMDKVNVANKLEAEKRKSFIKVIGNIFYYFLMIMVLLIVLEKLGVSQVLSPLQDMVSKFLAYLPNLIAAILIVYIGYMLAGFVSDLLKIGGNWVDKLAIKAGIKDTKKFIDVLRKIVFLIIFIPIVIQAFNILNLYAISESVNTLLNGFMSVIGKAILAIAVLLIFIYGGRFLINILKDILKGLGTDKLAKQIGIQNMFSAKQTLSGLIGNIAFFFIIFFGLITASEIVGLVELTGILNDILVISGRIFFGLIVILAGNYISKLIYDAIIRSDSNQFVANIVRFVTLALFIAMALRTMGIANSIVEMAFGLSIGAIAVTVALSYGLGGRDAAGEHFREILAKLKDKSSKKQKEATDFSKSNQKPTDSNN